MPVDPREQSAASLPARGLTRFEKATSTVFGLAVGIALPTFVFGLSEPAYLLASAACCVIAAVALIAQLLDWRSRA